MLKSVEHLNENGIKVFLNIFNLKNLSKMLNPSCTAGTQNAPSATRVRRGVIAARPLKVEPGQKRNTTRGFRSKISIEIRKIKRNNKRADKRRAKRLLALWARAPCSLAKRNKNGTT